jgi:nucleoside-diphosphate-sugar epimerase
MFQYASARWGTPVVILRLNYAVELRYGVLVDIGRAVFERRPISLSVPYVNVIWQGDANSWCLRSFTHCQSPPFILNITGPETLSVREIAAQFGRHFGVEPILVPKANNSTALLNDARKANALFGNPSVTPGKMIAWTAGWIQQGGVTLNKPTHFQTRDGRF